MSLTAPYGKWESPITPDSIVENNIGFDDVFADPVTAVVYHIERRPEDKGRYVIVNTKTDEDLISSPFSARTGVQEYGGAAAIAYDGIVYFSHFLDNRVYAVKGGAPEPVTPENPKYRYANFAVHPVHKHLLVSILEDHTVDTPQTVVTTLCVINTNLKAVYPLVAGADFYASPVFNPSATKIAWQEWYHPDMPWEGSLIYVADVLAQDDSLTVVNRVYVAGEKLLKAVSYPMWLSDTRLIFTSDQSNGFQNPFVYSTLTGTTELALLAPIRKDFGEPFWILGNFPCAIIGDGDHVAFIAFRDGRNVFYIVDLNQRSEPQEVEDFPFTVAQHVRRVSPTSFVFIGGKSDAPGGLALCTLTGPSFVPTYVMLKSSASALGNDGYISPPQPITLEVKGEPLHVVYYPPKNPKYSGSSIPGEKPPCIVGAHGGPTTLAAQVLNRSKMYFTSRGYAWLDVNYGGSSGYGRKYIQRLAGNWGIVDVQDCKDASVGLASAPYSLVDGSRVAIRGGSAGGFTTLAALSLPEDPSYFKAATSLSGISNLVSLAQFTHKFELKYMDKLLGGSLEGIPEVFDARSPIKHAERITVPLLVLHGAEDKVVLPEQAESIVNQIKAQPGGEDRVEYHLFEGEGHGWRLASSIKQALQLEHDWYDRKLL